VLTCSRVLTRGESSLSRGTKARPRGFVCYHHAAVPGIYLALVVAAAAVTAVSAARGTRAALAERASS
jgi:hypothetical protein